MKYRCTIPINAHNKYRCTIYTQWGKYEMEKQQLIDELKPEVGKF